MNVLILTITSALMGDGAAAPSPIAIADVRRNTTVSFADEIAPILRSNCLACHNAQEAEGGLVLETSQTILKAATRGRWSCRATASRAGC